VLLKKHGLRGTGVIGAYHVRMVVPLMPCALSLYEMTLGAQLDKMVLVHEALRDSEFMQHIKATTMVGDLDFVVPILGHPTMRPDVGFIELVSSS
jgi:hypothetical protein